MPNQQKKIMIISGAIVALLVIIGALYFIFKPGSGGKTQDLVSGAAEALFYDSLENGAKQQQLRVAMYRATYANKADADGAKNVGTVGSSVVELDTKQSKMRSVYATNSVNTPDFDIGRCMDGTTYSDDYSARQLAPPTTLSTAAEDLNKGERLYKVTQPLVFIPCPNLGLMPGAAADLASFRISDGVFPVTLNDQQAKNWKKQVVDAKLFDVKDAGIVDYKGKKVRKVSFTPKNQESVNKKLYDIFTDAAEIEKIKAENPKALYQYEFIATGPVNSGSVGGFYLIDEDKKLPVYSELYSTNPDRTAGDGASARFNIARTKQTYRFGQELSLTETSPLELLQ